MNVPTLNTQHYDSKDYSCAQRLYHLKGWSTVKSAYKGAERDQKTSVAVRFRFMYVLKIWIPGTAKVFREIQIYVIPRFRLRQISL